MLKTCVNGNKRWLVVNKRIIDGCGFEVAIPLPRRNKQVTTILDSKILTAADGEMKKKNKLISNKRLSGKSRVDKNKNK